MSKPVKNTDDKALFSVLHDAIESDKRYWIQNDAKIKACYTAKNYDEFRDIVAAAHLNGLNKNDMRKRSCRSWNAVATERKSEE